MVCLEHVGQYYVDNAMYSILGYILTSSPDIHSVVTSHQGARLAIKHFNHFKLLNVCVVFAQFKVGSCVPIIVDEQFPFIVNLEKQANVVTIIY